MSNDVKDFPLVRQSALQNLMSVFCDDASARANCAERRKAMNMNSAGSDFVRHVLTPMLKGCARRSALEDQDPDCFGVDIPCSLLELVEAELRAWKSGGFQGMSSSSARPDLVDAISRVVAVMTRTLLEHPQRCLVHVLPTVNAAVKCGAQIDEELLARESISDYFFTQCNAYNLLGRLIDSTDSDLSFCHAMLNSDLFADEGGSRRRNCKQDDAVDDADVAGDEWLYKPLRPFDNSSQELCIVFLLCDAIYASLKSSRMALSNLERVCNDTVVADRRRQCAQGRARESSCLCETLIAAVSGHVWCSEDVPLMDHLMLLFNEVDKFEKELRADTLTNEECIKCAVTIGAILTKTLPNLPTFLDTTSQIGLVLEGRAQVLVTEEEGGAEGKSGAIAHLQLLLACAQLQAQERATRYTAERLKNGMGRGEVKAYDLSLLKNVTTQLKNQGFLNIVLLLRASCGLRRTGVGLRGDVDNIFVAATLEVWGGVAACHSILMIILSQPLFRSVITCAFWRQYPGLLEVVRCASQISSAQGTSPDVVVLEEGSIVIEATSLLCEAMPREAVLSFGRQSAKVCGGYPAGKFPMLTCQRADLKQFGSLLAAPSSSKRMDFRGGCFFLAERGGAGRWGADARCVECWANVKSDACRACSLELI